MTNLLAQIHEAGHLVLSKRRDVRQNLANRNTLKPTDLSNLNLLATERSKRDICAILNK